MLHTRSLIHHCNNYSIAFSTLGAALGREKWGSGLPLEGSDQVLGPGCEDPLGEQRPSLGCIPIHLYGG